MGLITADYLAIRRFTSPPSVNSTIYGRHTPFTQRLYNISIIALFLVSLTYLLIFHTPVGGTKSFIKHAAVQKQPVDDTQLPPLPSAVRFRPRAASPPSVHKRSVNATVSHAFFNYTQARLAVTACASTEGENDLHCAAILHVECGPSGKVVYSGFMMYTTALAVLPVSLDTAHRIRAINMSQARDYATSLITSLATAYNPQFACGVRNADVAAAVFRAVPVVSGCLHTADPHCYDDYVVATC